MDVTEPSKRFQLLGLCVFWCVFTVYCIGCIWIVAMFVRPFVMFTHYPFGSYESLVCYERVRPVGKTTSWTRLAGIC